MPATVKAEHHKGRPQPALVLVATMMGVVLVTVDVSVVNVALEALQASFRVRIDGLQWVLNVYTLAYAAFLLSAGALSDRIGSRATFLMGFVLFTLTSLGCGVAPSFPVLLAARALQGLGAALLVPSALALLQVAFPDPRERAWAIGLWAGAGSFALAGGPILGGALIAVFGWRSVFLINLPLGLLGLWLTWQYAPAPARTVQRSLDLPGQAAGTAALACFTAAITQVGTLGWGNPWIIGGLAAAALLGGLFLAIEVRSAHPMMPVSLFRDPVFSTASIVGFTINFAFYELVFVFSLFFQTVQARSAFETGLAFAPMTAVIMAVNLAAGRLNGRFGLRPMLGAGLALAASGYLTMMFVQAGTSYAMIAPSFVLTGIGIAIATPAMMTAALASTHATQAGIGSGVVNSARQVGGAVGVALFGSLIGAAGPGGFVGAMHLVLLVAGFSLLAGAVAALAIIPAQPKPCR